MQKLLFIVVSLILSIAVVAQDKELSLNEKIGINNLKDHVMYKRKESVAMQIKYPLERCGYSLTLKNGKAVTSAGDTAPGDRIVTMLADGTIASVVEENKN